MTGRYQEYFESGVCEEKYKELAAAAASPDLLSPDDCFWLGKCLSVCSESESCSLSIYCIERAFELGLTSSSDKERYVDASLLLSRMYIRKGDYTLAMNHLYYLVNNISNTSDSVIVYFLISQIMSDQVFYITKKPDFFFKRLEGLNTETQSKIYAVFLKRINDLMNEHGEYLPELNYDMFYGLKKKYNADYEQPMSENPEYAELDRLYAETESFGFSQKHIVEKKKYEVREDVTYYSREQEIKIVSCDDNTIDYQDSGVEDNGYNFLKQIARLPQYSFDTYTKIHQNDGLFFFFERGQMCREFDRIVYVGCSDRTESIIAKIRGIYDGDKDQSELRKYIGASILNKTHNSYCRIWMKNSSDKKALRKIGTFYDPKLQAEIEGKISQYLNNNIKISCISILSHEKRKTLQEKIINSLADSYILNCDMSGWLGSSMPDPAIRNSGIWNASSVSNVLRLKDLDILDISILLDLHDDTQCQQNSNKESNEGNYTNKQTVEGLVEISSSIKTDNIDEVGEYTDIDELYGRLHSTELIEKLRLLKECTSHKYTTYLRSLFSFPTIPDTDDERIMLTMLYYHLYSDLPDEMGFSSQNDFIQYLNNIPILKNMAIEISNGNKALLSKQPSGLSDISFLELGCKCLRSDLLTSIRYWTWDSHIPAREDMLYIRSINCDIVFICLDGITNYVVDNKTLIWTLPAKIRAESDIWSRYINNNEGHKTILCVRNNDDSNINSYYYLGAAICIEQYNDIPLRIKWELRDQLSSELENVLVKKTVPDDIETELTESEKAVEDILHYILENDIVQTPYKYSLFTSLVEICQNESSYANLNDEKWAYLPVGLLVWKWILYYYRLLSSDKFIALLYGEKADEGGKRSLFIRKPFGAIIAYYKTSGGCNALNRDIIHGSAPQYIQKILFDLVKELRETIITKPMKHFGNSLSLGGEYLIFHITKQQTRMRNCDKLNLSYMIDNCGEFYLPKGIYDYLAGKGGRRILDDVNITEKWLDFILSIGENKSLTRDEIIPYIPKITI